MRLSDSHPASSVMTTGGSLPRPKPGLIFSNLYSSDVEGIERMEIFLHKKL